MATKSQKEKPSPQPMELFTIGNQVRGILTLNNPGQETLKLKEIEVSKTNLRDAAGNPLTHISCFARIRPGQTLSFPVLFQLDGTLAPGDYPGEFVNGEILRQPFIVRVTEEKNTNISPDPCSVHGTPGQRLTKELFVTNKGNVSIAIDEIWCLADSKFPPLEITLAKKYQPLEPRQTQKITLNTLVPKGLLGGCKYEYTLEIAGEEIQLELYIDTKIKEASNAV